jgi:hypothetical protein
MEAHRERGNGVGRIKGGKVVKSRDTVYVSEFDVTW